jgi:hypothetical protein
MDKNNIKFTALYETRDANGDIEYNLAPYTNFPEKLYIYKSSLVGKTWNFIPIIFKLSSDKEGDSFTVDVGVKKSEKFESGIPEVEFQNFFIAKIGDDEKKFFKANIKKINIIKCISNYKSLITIIQIITINLI